MGKDQASKSENSIRLKEIENDLSMVFQMFHTLGFFCQC